MIWIPKRLSRVQLAERRREGFKLLQRKRLSQRAIAKRLGVSEAAVSQWCKMLNEEGLRGARARCASGRPSRLNIAEHKELIRVLKGGAVKAGFVSERWTQQRIQKVIEQRWDVSYHPRSIGRILKGLGWSVQYPRGQARERDEALIRAWLAQDWPRIKKSTSFGSRHRVY
jgi:transposase